MSSGTSEKASHVLCVVLGDSHSCGGLWETSMSNPCSCADGASIRDSSVSQILESLSAALTSRRYQGAPSPGADVSHLHSIRNGYARVEHVTQLLLPDQMLCVQPEIVPLFSHQESVSKDAGHTSKRTGSLYLRRTRYSTTSLPSKT